MAIADELAKLETNRANIVAAINSKGGELAENAGLAACPEAISQLSSAGGTTLWTGHVDEAGLRYIGWNDEDIANLKANICWDEEDDELYAVPQDHKDLWDACEKVEVNGRTMIAYRELSKWKAIDFYLRYLPMVDTSAANGSRLFSEMVWLYAIPNIDASGFTSLSGIFRVCVNLLYIPNLVAPNVTNAESFAEGCKKLLTCYLSGTSSVTNMQNMFSGCSFLREVPLLDTSSVTNMQNMFYGCSSLREVPLLDTSSVTNMQGMFYGCSSLREVPQFNTSRCKTIFQIFDRSVLVDFRLNMATIIDCNQIFNQCKWLLRAHFTFTSLMTGAQNWFINPRNITEMSFADTCSLAGVKSANNMFANSTSNSIPKGCVNYILVKQVCEMMLRGVPAYSAASYPMYFESGSAVTDDAAGTLQSLVEQCQAMGWAIYNLTINPYTE